ncbi:hypothetical protein WN51_04531 [Melipona quadrifasciata]|uniref:Uncharacterized protein n=1 Tax=Melipona quadrifasciata TaxID=166423 RepID=A0A0M8ZU34_9HYME|nr:hypothetical protein WN51_04531 [Melipona quadrifasciata]
MKKKSYKFQELLVDLKLQDHANISIDKKRLVRISKKKSLEKRKSVGISYTTSVVIKRLRED